MWIWQWCMSNFQLEVKMHDVKWVWTFYLCTVCFGLYGSLIVYHWNDAINIAFIQFGLRVQNEQFSKTKKKKKKKKKKRFILRDIDRKYTFRPDSNPRSMDYRANSELSDLLMNGHKNSAYQVPIALFTKQSRVRNCHKITNCEQFRTKRYVKLAATIKKFLVFVFCLFVFSQRVSSIR